MAQVFSNIVAIGGGATYDIRPPVGQDWEITDIGFSHWAGVPPASVPAINVSIFNGVLRSLLLSLANIRGWLRKQKLSINNTTYVRLTNPGAAGNASFSAKVIKDYGTGTSSVISDIVSLGAGITYAVRPPVGQEWLINDVGSSIWLGALPAAVPDVTIDITDGVSLAALANATNGRGWDQELNIYINNANYVLLTNTSGGLASVSFSGVVARDFGTGLSTVVTDVVTLGAGGVLTIRPPVGEEWKITEIGSSVWTAGPPSFPDVLVEMTDGILTAIMAQGTDSKDFVNSLEILIDRDNYLQITDTFGGGQDVGFSAVKTLVY